MTVHILWLTLVTALQSFLTITTYTIFPVCITSLKIILEDR